MLTKISSIANVGLETVPVDVEVDVASAGFPGFTIVGLASKAVEEARERVKTAIINSGFDFPPKKITVNLAPADLPKDGAAYDLPIAIGVLVSSGQLAPNRLETKFLLWGTFLGWIASPHERHFTVGPFCKTKKACHNLRTTDLRKRGLCRFRYCYLPG